MTDPTQPPGSDLPGPPPDPTAAPPPFAGSSMPGGTPPPGAMPPPAAPQYGAPGPGTPGGGYPPPGSPYGTGPAPVGYANQDEKTWAMLAHFGGAVGAFISFGPLGFVGPLIAYLAKGQQSPAVRAHALAALNFQVLWSGIAFLLFFVSWCLLFIPSVIVFGIQIAMGVIAGIKANEGQLYRYPMSPTFIK
ncbi:MAG TPA: DUF4870 domain-containing protein [Micromonospora sp.]|nr:DUF4870 domain-containing protein [Micromonospora sp.]